MMLERGIEVSHGAIRLWTLKFDRVHGRRFKFIKIGRSIYYRVEDIESVLDNHVIDGLVDQ